jgi:hypothetical protein
VIEVPSPAWLDRGESLFESEQRQTRRTGPETFVFGDLVAGVAIEGRVLSDVQWILALGDRWSARVRPLGDLEWFIVATRR